MSDPRIDTITKLVALPEGWVMVPRIPDDELDDKLDAAFHAEFQKQHKSSMERFGKPAFASGPFIRAMMEVLISAAPLPSDPLPVGTDEP